jgi:hypothetical protein
VNDGVPRGLVPPRPNLGPEPWPDAGPITGLLLVLGLMAALLLAGAGLLWRHHRKAPRVRQGRLAPAAGFDSQPTPRDRLVALAESVRDALTVQFGAPSRAKTTEEWAADARLVQLLGEPDFQELIRFLDQIDRVKFAPEHSDNHHEAIQEALVSWEPRVASLQARLRIKPRSRAKGRAARSQSSDSGPRTESTNTASRDPRRE